MKNIKFLYIVYCLFTLISCNSSTVNKPAPTPPVSAKEAIISVEKALNGLLPDCAVKIQETPKGIELKESKAAFNCNTSDSIVPSYQLKTLENNVTSLLSTLVVAKKSALDTNQINYVEAIESEAKMIALSIRNSLVRSEKADRETGARITTLLKKWDCQMQNVPMEKWPIRILTASDSTCKKNKFI